MEGSIIKHTAYIYVHGGMAQWDVNYWETFSPVLNWISIRFFLTLSIFQELLAEYILYTLVFP